MYTRAISRRLFRLFACLTWVGCLTATVLISRSAEWNLELFSLLLGLALVGIWLMLSIRGQHLTAGFISLVLAMSLLGPAPAVVISTVAVAVNCIRRRLPFWDWVTNFTDVALFPLVGGLLVLWVAGDVHDPANAAFTRGVTFGLVVFGVFMITNLINFAVVALDIRLTQGRSLKLQFTDLFVPMLPSQIATGALAALLAVAYTNLGLPVLLAAVLVLLIFQYLTIALLRSEDRADQLEARSIHLASLQLGVLSTLVETLALRDRTTARHAAAVARYARELAVELGLDPDEQELVHTAGLLHDIGKFALPDAILRAQVLSDDDWAQIRRHPQDGATLVGRLDGYGAVAEAILYHHERVDGSGYPVGLIGSEIPLASRIVAVCSTYDTLTARGGYRPPMTPQDAIAELRRVAGKQLDTELVERFVAMVERKGTVALGPADEADFEEELAFGRRVRQIAQPS
jgi:putative nucleotidyltransferase with HDIG domain